MPPKKQAGKKTSLKDKKKQEEQLKISRTLKELLKNYVLKCGKDQSICYPPFQDQILRCKDEGNYLARLILAEIPPRDGLTVKLEPAIAALRSVRYVYIKDVFVWDIPVKYEDMASLSDFIQQPAYSVSYLEMINCQISSFSLGRFKECLATKSLTALVMDFNGFGDEGCRELCSGLEGNCTLIKLSLKFCALTAVSGIYLGKAISETAISEVYLDGNKLECEGLIELLQMVADRSEQESLEKKSRNVVDNESYGKGRGHFLGIKTNMSAMAGDDVSSGKGESNARPTQSAKSRQSTAKSKKKKRKKSPKKKAPPKVGPWLTKLHVMDNGIDSHGIASKFAPVLCMRLVKRWLATAADLLELDIDDNLIGDMGGREILNGLQERKEAGLPNVKIWITHRLHPDTFKQILALGTAAAKKSKKKGKPGKKKV